MQSVTPHKEAFRENLSRRGPGLIEIYDSKLLNEPHQSSLARVMWRGVMIACGADFTDVGNVEKLE